MGRGEKAVGPNAVARKSVNNRESVEAVLDLQAKAEALDQIISRNGCGHIFLQIFLPDEGWVFPSSFSELSQTLEDSRTQCDKQVRLLWWHNIGHKDFEIRYDRGRYSVYKDKKIGKTDTFDEAIEIAIRHNCKDIQPKKKKRRSHD